MKLVGMRIEDNLASRLDKLASDKNKFYSKNEAYQKILEIGIKHFEGEY
jgi:predicted transcriptional regulator